MLNIIPLGGMGNVTKNLFVYDYNGSILIVDCGIGFPDENMPGVDVLIPDVGWLMDKKSRIVGMVLTHGHDDHIAGLPYIIPQIGDNFPIYASPLTRAFAQSRLKEFGIQKKILLLDDLSPLRLSPFTVHSIAMTHSVPDTRHLVIETPSIRVYHGSDFKIDLTPVDGVRPDLMKVASFGQKGITLLLSDCLRSEKEGFSLSETTLTDTFEREIRDVKGKFVVTTMSSNVHRIQQAVCVASSHHRKIAFIGRSIEQNIRDAQSLGMIDIPKKMIIDKRDIRRVPAAELCLIIAGSQGQAGSSLVRAAEEEHDFVQLTRGDKVIFSADPIPGNETNVYSTIDSLSRLGVDVVYSDVDDNLHVSGHASSGELKLLIQLTKPRYIMPIGGTYRHMIQYQHLATNMGYSDKNVFILESGQTIAVDDHGNIRTGITVQLKTVMVDGLGIGDVGTVVLRDRQTMAKDGIVIIILPLERETGLLAGKIELVSRGFVYMKESKDFMAEATTVVQQAITQSTKKTDWQSVRASVAKALEKFFWVNTKRTPMILPVIIEV